MIVGVVVANRTRMRRIRRIVRVKIRINSPHPRHLRAISRELGEFVEVGLALFEERLLALLRLFRQVIEQGGVACQLLDAGLPVGSDCTKRPQQMVDPQNGRPAQTARFNGGGFELVERCDFVDQPHI